MNMWILQLLGTPTESDLGFTHNEDAKRYIRQLPNFPRQPLAKLFSHVNPLAIDLVDRMLTFDPSKRITGKCIIRINVYMFSVSVFSSSWLVKTYYLVAMCSWRSSESPLPSQVARPEWWANLSKAILFRLWTTTSRRGTDKRDDLQGSHCTQSNICLEEQQPNPNRYPLASLLVLLFMYLFFPCVILLVCLTLYYC